MWDRASFHVANPTSPQFCRRQMRHCPDRGSKEAPKRFSMRVSKYFPYCHPDQQMFPRNFFHVYCFTLVSVNKSRQMATVKGEMSAFGTGNHKKRDEFSEKFQTAFHPPPSFSENYIADFATKVRMFILAGLLNII